MIPFFGEACALGALAGLGFAWLWRRLVPRGTNRAFWSSMSGLTRRMLEVEQAGEFLCLYRTLGGLVARYVGRNLGGTLVACVPMVAIVRTVAPMLFAAWDARAPRMALVPVEAACQVLETTPGPIGLNYLLHSAPAPVRGTLRAPLGLGDDPDDRRKDLIGGLVGGVTLAVLANAAACSMSDVDCDFVWPAFLGGFVIGGILGAGIASGL